MKILLRITTVFIILEYIKAGVIPRDKFNNYDFPELKYINKDIDPCDNFYEFSCGNYAKYNPKPEGQIMWDGFKMLQKNLDDTVLEILQSKIRSKDPKSVKKAKDMYNACVNMDQNDYTGNDYMEKVIKNLGGWPLISNYNRYKNIEFSWETIGEIIAEYGLPMFVNVVTRPYLLNANINMIQISRDPLVLPQTAINHPDIIPNDFLPKTHKETKTPYVQYLNNIALIMKDHIGTWKDPSLIENDVQEVLKIMLEIKQSANYPFEDFSGKNLVPDTIEDLQLWSDGFGAHFKTRINWQKFFKQVFRKSRAKITKDTKVYLGDKDTIANILSLVERTDPVKLRDFVITRLMTYMAPDATSKLWEEFNTLYKRLNYSTYNRTQYCMRKVATYPNIGLSMAISHEYQNYYFNLNKIEHPKQMIENLMTAFFDLLKDNPWMDADARKWVQNKAKHMLRLIAFPDFIYDPKTLDKYYSKLKIGRYTHFENSQNLRAFNFMKLTEGIDKPRDRDIWTQSPLIVNAYYNQLNNRLTFPAGIMNPPFYTGKNNIIDYTRIGALIGHEITHGFDSNGRNTDANGTMTPNPWNQTVKDAFDQKKKCFIEQYSQYYIEEIDRYVNGSTTITENIADNGGLREAYQAFKTLDKNRSNLQPISEYTVDQLFFISYGAMWCSIDTKASLEKLAKDVHAPNRFRVIGTLSNMEEFARAFNCPKNSKMNPESKCVLW